MRHVPGFDPGWRRYEDERERAQKDWILVDCLDPFFDWIPDQSLSSTFVIGDRGQASGTSVEDDRGGGGEDDRGGGGEDDRGGRGEDDRGGEARMTEGGEARMTEGGEARIVKVH